MNHYSTLDESNHLDHNPNNLVTDPQHGIWTPSQVISHIAATGNHFFCKESMRFFRSKLADFVFGRGEKAHLIFFITSEQYVNTHRGVRDRRKYTVRRFHPEAKEAGYVISEPGSFQEFDNLRQARRAAERLLSTERQWYLVRKPKTIDPEDPGCIMEGPLGLSIWDIRRSLENAGHSQESYGKVMADLKLEFVNLKREDRELSTTCLHQ